MTLSVRYKAIEVNVSTYYLTTPGPHTYITNNFRHFVVCKSNTGLKLVKWNTADVLEVTSFWSAAFQSGRANDDDVVFVTVVIISFGRRRCNPAESRASLFTNDVIIPISSSTRGFNDAQQRWANHGSGARQVCC